ncbi:uricase [Cristinia sonorae]|uniref:Uricase n=1 Tax=Cristinia sonorae TaxID=1940300 RepID=A0A8K0UK81_9AGAR|nr:uricase [Cristinia sonorae]
MSNEGYLSYARYGKDKVRVFRIVREGKWHHVVEYNVCALLEGAIETSYTQADNSVVVATDSIKNITYYLAKTSPHILHPERFAIHLGSFLVKKYPHIHKAFVSVEKLRWKRIEVDEKEHPHAFFRDGEDLRVTSVEIDGTQGKDKLVAKVTSGIKGLLVLKSTGSAFENFIRDEFTTLVEVNDRIFSTSIDLSYTFSPFPISITDGNSGEVSAVDDGKGTPWDGESVAELARKVTLEVFAKDESASVQATLYKMAQDIISAQPHVTDVQYALPNKHYVPVDMKYIGLENLKPDSAEVFVPLAAPSGLISARVLR